jgi:hypothetical protein
VLERKYPGVKVSGYTLDVVDTGTTNRRRIFLHYAEEDLAKGYPKSVFCKGAQDLANRITMSAGSGPGEVQFFNELRPQIDFDAPKALFAGFDPVSFRSIIVLDDMAGEVEFCSYKTPMSRARAESQMDLLARMHGRFYDSPDFKGPLASMDRFQDRFHRINDYHGLTDACYRGLVAAESVVPPALLNRIEEVWPRTLESVSAMDTLPQTVTHGDVHLGNWYVHPNDQMGLTDFQNCNRGHWSRDVAYTISTSLTVENRRAWEKDLLRLYLAKLKQYGGVTESWNESWKNYRQQLLTVFAWWTVTLTPSPSMVAEMQTKETTLEFIHRIGYALDDLASLDAFD